MKLRILLFFLFVSTQFVKAQVSYVFIPEVHGRTIDGLFQAKILNGSARRNVRLQISVSERKSGRIVNIRTAPFMLAPGNNSIPSSAIRNAKIQFSNSRNASLIQQNGYLPEGVYEYCYSIIPDGYIDPEIEIPTEECITYEMTPSAPLELTEPFNQDKLCEKKPLFAWQPSFPQVPGSAYQLVLAEIKERQNATEALSYNLPLITQMGIISPVMPYPPSVRELESGKKYAWQVTSYKDQTVLNRSEVWEFTVECKDSVIAKIIPDEGYRNIEDLLKGNYYIANGSILFSLVNSYEEQELKYEIQSLANAVETHKRLPKVKLEKGRNKVRIVLTGDSSFKENDYYILKLYMPNGSNKSLRFIYKRKNEN